MNRKINIYMLILFCVIGVYGCGTPYLEMVLHSTEKINPDDSGNALPVVVRLYQLADNAAIEKADLSSLWDKDREILGSDIITREEITLFPSSNMTIKIDRDPKGLYLGVVSFYRKPSGESWRQVLKLSKTGRQNVQINLSEYDLNVVILQ